MTSARGRQDLYCGAVLVAIGGVAVWEGRHHRIGTLTQMQAGYFPIILGVILIGLGILIAAAGLRWRGDAAAAHEQAFEMPDWRGFGAIVFGGVAFIAVGAWFGLAPATFCCVFIAALGDRTNTPRRAAILAASLTVVAVLLFAYLLQVQFPVLQWPTT